MRNKKWMALCFGAAMSAALLGACGTTPNTGDNGGGGGGGGGTKDEYTASEVITITTAATQFINTEVDIAYALDHGYELAEITVDGEKITSAKYIFTQLKDYSLTVTAKKDDSTLSLSKTVTVTENDALMPITVTIDGACFVNDEKDLSCTLTDGYALQFITVRYGDAQEPDSVDLSDPMYVFENLGQYDVTYVATKNGSTKTATKTVTVTEDEQLQPISCALSDEYTVNDTADLMCTLSDGYVLQSIKLTTAENSQDIATDNTEYTFAAEGEYTVKYTATKNGSTKTLEKTIAVQAPAETPIEKSFTGYYSTKVAVDLSLASGEIKDGYTLQSISVKDAQGNVTAVAAGNYENYIFNKTGNYKVVYAVEKDGDTSTAEVPIRIGMFKYTVIEAEEADATIATKTGNWEAGGKEDGAMVKSSIAGDTYTLKFTGIGFKIYVGTGGGAGKISVNVDDKEIATVNCNRKTANGREMVYSNTDFEQGEHTLVLTNVSDVAKQVNINLNAFEIVSTSGYEGECIEVETDTTDMFSFYNADGEAAEWTNNGSAMQSTNVGEYVEFEFTGIGMRIFLGAGTGAGKYKIIIDDEEVAENNAYASIANPNSLQFSIDDLQYGKHKVRIVNLGDGAGANKNFNFNAVEIITGKV